MNKLLYYLILFVGLFLHFSCEKNKDLDTSMYNCNFNFKDSSNYNLKSTQYQSVIDNMIKNGVVGVNMSVHEPKTGMWIGASGMADLHNHVSMKPCTISRFGSTVKMITATTIFKLKEEGKLQLDDKISEYLSGDIINKIKNADKATIRQLLHHSSGIYNYIESLQFQTASLNDFVKVWKPNDLLQYAYNKDANFNLDEDVNYSNTGYIMLGMLIEKIEGKAFYKVFEEKIFHPIGMDNTIFAAENNIPVGIARGYIDMYSKLQVTESTYFSGWDYFTADGGLISNPYDMSIFFQALLSEQLISNGSLQEMMNWRKEKSPDPAYFPIWYGLGIFKIETDKGIAYMHSGDAVGYYANMLYFPDHKTTIVYAVNSNYGKIDQFVSTQGAIQNIIAGVLK